MKVTIKDIAKKAGVSPGAVSKALNGRPDISEATRTRILEISKNLGYTPNLIARSLVKQGNNTIGVLIPDISTPLYPNIYRGINEAALKYGYTLFLGDTKRSLENERKYILNMMANRVAGLLVSPVSSDVSHIESIVQGQVPIIYFGGKVNDTMNNSIGVDNYNGAIKACNYLLELGHKRIEMVCDNLETKTRSDRVEAFRFIMNKAGLKPTLFVDNEGLSGRECGRAVIRRIIAYKHPMPTAIFALNDSIAIGVLEALNEAGLKVPEDVSVIGYDDIPYASLFMIGLTTICQPKFEIGEMSLELLHAKLGEKREEANKKIILGTELIIRTSTCNVIESRNMH